MTSRETDPKRVAVIGAGLAGLTAAYQLKKNTDLDVFVLESKKEPGGRMLTTDYGFEKGGESIGLYYSNLHRITEELGVKLESAPLTIMNQAFDLAYYFQRTKTWIKQKEWADHPQNWLPEPYKKIPPMMLFRSIVNRYQQPAPEHLLKDDFVKKIANQSLKDFLSDNELPEEALPLIESNFELNHDLDKLSAYVSVSKTWITNPMENSKFYHIDGGNQALPKALANAVGHVFYNQNIVSVEKKHDHIQLISEQGEHYEADYVIFAGPIWPMKRMNIIPILDDGKLEAIEHIRYTPNIKIAFKVTKPFWLEDKLPLVMWTDTAINMVFPIYDVETRETPLMGPDLWGLYTVSNGIRYRQLKREAEEKGMLPAEYAKTIIETIRPSMKGAIEIHEVHDWGTDPSVMGAFHYYEPSPNVLQYIQDLRRPCGNFYFAGEHTEYLSRGFDAAVNSGIRAAKEVQEAVCRKVA